MARTAHRSAMFLVALALLLAASAGRLHAAPPESNQPIRIIVNDWTSQVVFSRVIGAVFERMDYAVVYEEADFRRQWGHLHRGNFHVEIEVWEGTMGVDFERMVANGNVVDAGTHPATTGEGWWYPSYVEELCPGLPDWRALNGCASLFATPETAPKGRFLAGYWDKFDDARIRALDLDFVTQKVQTIEALFVELKKAVAANRPIMLLNWQPNWVQSRYKGAFVVFPEYDPKCVSDPSWGINAKWTHDCGQPMDGWLKKAAWSGMETTWPCAWQTLRRMELSNSMMGQVAAYVDANGMSHSQAAAKWMTENRSIWHGWIPVDCREPISK